MIAPPRAAGRTHGAGTLLFLALCYLAFIVYGSLVPLDFKPRPLNVAWQDFLNTPYLLLGVESRADWVANGVLYAPLGFLLAAWLGVPRRPVLAQIILGSMVFAFCAALALGIEFTQLFFPPRTVSMNDIIAEFIGSIVGIVVCMAWGGKLGQLQSAMRGGGTLAIRAAAVAYLLAYVALSLFPYDFYISSAEFAEKFLSDSYGFFIAPASCDRWSLCTVKLVAETLIVIPLGLLLSLTLGKSTRHPYAIAVWYGLALGLLMEAAQLFMASGISQGLSVLTRVVGFLLGMALQQRAQKNWFTDFQPYFVPAAAILSVPYLLALMWLNGWFSAPWGDIGYAINSSYGIKWMPFYYHYYTTEQGALRSLIVVGAMYMPVGFAYWAWAIRHTPTYAQGNALLPALVAAPLATAMEAGKLFVDGKRADPTDILIAAVAAAMAYLFATQLQRWALQGAAAPAISKAPKPAVQSAAVRRPSRETPTTPAAAHGIGSYLTAAMLLAGTAWALTIYPLGSALLLAALGVYAACIWRYPRACLPALLALLPLLNFAPWTGWILLNEFDLFVAVTLAVRLMRRPLETTHERLPRSAAWTISLLAFAYVASAVAGLWPWTPLDQNTLFSYFGSLDSLRVLKGFAWAVALLPLLLEKDTQDPQSTQQQIATGMLIGLCAALSVVAWERLVFASVMDFSSDYRVEGPFPELHTGGGDINAYLVLALPFVAWWATLRPTMVRVSFAMAVFIFASYAVAVTFTRGGYVGYFGTVLVLALAAACHGLRKRGASAASTVTIASMAVAGAAVIAAIGASSFMETRLATTKVDAGTRTQHWVHAYEMMDSNITTTLFGMGLGTFPRTLLAKNREAASATFSYLREGDNTFVRMGSGRALYLAQQVAVAPGKRYTLSVALRSRAPGAELNVALCEKSVQSSFDCASGTIKADAPEAGWTSKAIVLNTEQLGSLRQWLQRPVVISLSNAQRSGAIDVDTVRLTDDNGRDLLTNGDFAHGGARWHFATDDHLPWHIFNLWVQILFELGVLGVLAFGLLAALALFNLVRRTWHGDWFAGSLLAALAGFLLLGFTESLFDGPRVTTLFYLLLFLGLRPARST